MPNWCHNTLTVTGDPDALADFVERARERLDEERLRADYADPHRFGDPEQSFEEYAAWRRDRRSPLSFDALVPYDPDEWETTYRECFVCGGTGERPDGLARFGAEWMASVNGCNGCRGTGRAVAEEGWWRHHISEWGCKWDASFGGGPLFAMGAETTDVEATVEAQGATVTPTVAVYKFDTPWSPPLPFVARASELFPDLEFALQYAEVGHGEAGRIRYVSGVTVETEDLEVEDVLAPEEMWF